jgi:hypothetical protein
VGINLNCEARSKINIERPLMHNWLDDGNEIRCGGIGRVKYFLLQISLPLAFGLGLFALESMSVPINYLQTIGSILIFGLFASLIWANVQRFKNMGYHWCFIFTLFIPLINLYYLVLLSIAPEGYEVHEKLDRPAKIVVGFFLVMFILSVVVYALTVALS